jgi:hypothetical protein
MLIEIRIDTNMLVLQPILLNNYKKKDSLNNPHKTEVIN